MLRITEIELYDEDYFDSMIDEITPPISIMGIAFTPSSVFKTDKSAYREFCNNTQESLIRYACPFCLDWHDDESSAMDCCWSSESDTLLADYLEAVAFTEGFDCIEDLNLSDEARESALEDIKGFAELSGDILSDYSASFAGNLWYSRNGHGVGFFDADTYSEQHKTQLQKNAKTFGSSDFYVGDDGLGYFA
jgi:hypothetical protein